MPFKWQCQKFTHNGFQFDYSSAIDLNKSLTLATLQGLISWHSVQISAFSSHNSWLFEGAITLLLTILNKNSWVHSIRAVGTLFLLWMKKSSKGEYTCIIRPRDYLAWKQWPGASLRIAPSSSFAWDPWRRGPPHTRLPPTRRSVWQRWRPSPTHTGSARSTWLVLPESKEQAQSHVLPTLQFSFSCLSFLKLNHPCICSLCSNASLTLPVALVRGQQRTLG